MDIWDNLPVWLRWCWKCKKILPKSVACVSHRELTESEKAHAKFIDLSPHLKEATNDNR